MIPFIGGFFAGAVTLAVAVVLVARSEEPDPAWPWHVMEMSAPWEREVAQ